MLLKQAGFLTLLLSLALAGLTGVPARETVAERRASQAREVTLTGEVSWVISAQAIGVKLDDKRASLDGPTDKFHLDETQARVALRSLARRMPPARALDVEATLSELRSAVRGGMRKPVRLIARPVPPPSTQTSGDTLATVTLKIPDDARGHNMRAALTTLDATVIRSGSWLSLREALEPFAPSRGFVFASAHDSHVCLGAGAEAIADLLGRAASEAGLTVVRNELPRVLAATIPMTRDLLVGNRSGAKVVITCEVGGDRGALRIMGRGLLEDRSKLSPRPASGDSGISVALVGDVLPTGPVGDSGELGQLMRSSDLALANLECAVSRRGKPMPIKLTPGEWAFRADPDAARQCLKDWSIGAVSLANNHALDYGPDALADTIRTVADAGISFAGAGKDEVSARRPVLLDRGGLRIALLCCVGSDTLPATGEFSATSDRPGLAVLAVDAAHIAQACVELASRVRDARWQADVVIVSLHSGREATGLPTDAQQRLAQAALRAGADLVWGHHPHRLQPVKAAGEGDGLISYGLGNFIFPPARDKQAHSGVLVVRWGSEGLLGAGFVPAIIEGRTPRLVHDAKLRQQIAGELLDTNG